jgi:hypothetical protein
VLSLLGLILAISLAMCVGQGRRGRRLNPPGAATRSARRDRDGDHDLEGRPSWCRQHRLNRILYLLPRRKLTAAAGRVVVVVGR